MGAVHPHAVLVLLLFSAGYIYEECTAFYVYLPNLDVNMAVLLYDTVISYKIILIYIKIK